MPVISAARNFVVLPLLLAMVLAASVFAFTPTADAATRSQRVAHAFSIVRNQLGDMYQYGAEGPHRFDCSGLVYYSYRKAGFTRTPRTSDSQARFTRRIQRDNMRKGDLVFFHSGGNVYHVAVFAGFSNGRRMIIHASKTGTPVKRDPIWTNSWFPGTMR